MEIRAIGIDSDEVPDFVRARGEKDLFPVSRPARIIRIVARDVLKNVHLTGRDLYPGHVTHVSRVAGLFDGVKSSASSIRRDRRKNSVGDLLLVRAVEIGDVNGIIAF